MKEPKIEINGREVTPAIVMTISTAIENFAIDLKTVGLGEDDHGVKMKASYLARIEEIRALMADNQ